MDIGNANPLLLGDQRRGRQFILTMTDVFQGLDWLVGVARRRWVLLLSIWLLCVGGAVLYVMTAKRIYRAEVVIAPAEKDKMAAVFDGVASQLGGLAALAGASLSEGDESDVAIAMLTGREFTQRFISEVNLLPILFSDRWDSQRKQWRGRPPSLSEGFRLFESEGIRTILRDRRTGFITLRIEFDDPVLAARWATELVRRTNSQLRESAIADSRSSIDYLDQQLAATQVVELRQALHRLREAQMKRAMFAQARNEYALRIVDGAVIADADDFVRPRRMLVLLSAALAGIFAAIVIAASIDQGGHDSRLASG